MLTSVDDLRLHLLDFAEPHSTDVGEYIALIETLYTLYIRENVTGPSIYTLYVEEEKRPLIKGEPLPEKDTDAISNKNTALNDMMIAHFERDSEQIFLKTQFLIVFFAIETFVLNEECIKRFQGAATEEQLKSFELWKARYYFLYDKQMTSNVAHLQDQSLVFYDSYLEWKSSHTDMTILS
jgi:hypothetical protein